MDLRNEAGKILGKVETYEYDHGLYYVEGAAGPDAWEGVEPYAVLIAYTEEELAAKEAAKLAAESTNMVALALAQKLANATTLSQVRSFSKQVVQEYAVKTDTENE